MLRKAKNSSYFCFWKMCFILQLGIWTTRSEFCEDTFTIYKDETLVIRNGVIIQDSVSLAQCTTECRSNVKCCAARNMMYCPNRYFINDPCTPIHSLVQMVECFSPKQLFHQYSKYIYTFAGTDILLVK
jgi:hypothetical protein